jgi:hypothetical protein
VNKSGSRGTLMGPVRAPTSVNEARARPPWARTRLVRVKGDPDETCACPARAHHYGGSNRGGVGAPHDGACTIEGVAYARAPSLPLNPGPTTALPWLLARILGGSLGAHPHLLPFFSTQIEFLNSIFRNDMNSRRSARCCGK